MTDQGDSLARAETERDLSIDLETSTTIGEFDAAQILEISIDELRTMRRENRGPAYIAVVRDIVRYYPDVVMAYGDAIVNEDKNFPLGW